MGIKRGLFGLLSLFIVNFISSCEQSGEIAPFFTNSFTLDSSFYNVNTNEVKWNTEVNGITAVSTQGTAISVNFNEKPSASKCYKVVVPAKLSQSPDYCSLTMVPPNFQTYNSTGNSGSILDVTVEKGIINIEFGYVEMSNGFGDTKLANGSFNSLASK